MRGRGPGETGNSRDGPGSSSFTGHSTGPKGGRLTFGKGTYFNIFAPNMDGDDEASIKARAWRRLEQAKLLEHYLNDIKLKNQVFNQRLASMQKTMADEEKKLKDEQAAAANQLRTKAAQDVKMMKKTVSEVVGQVEKKLTIMQQEAWANISSRVEAEAKNQQEAADIQTVRNTLQTKSVSALPCFTRPILHTVKITCSRARGEIMQDPRSSLLPAKARDGRRPSSGG